MPFFALFVTGGIRNPAGLSIPMPFFALFVTGGIRNRRYRVIPMPIFALCGTGRHTKARSQSNPYAFPHAEHSQIGVRNPDFPSISVLSALRNCPEKHMKASISCNFSAFQHGIRSRRHTKTPFLRNPYALCYTYVQVICSSDDLKQYRLRAGAGYGTEQITAIAGDGPKPQIGQRGKPV